MGIAQRIERNAIEVLRNLLVDLCKAVLIPKARLPHRIYVNNHLIPPFSCQAVHLYSGPLAPFYCTFVKFL